jgi:hypothetical protein
MPGWMPNQDVWRRIYGCPAISLPSSQPQPSVWDLHYFGETPAQKYRCGNCSACEKRKRPLKELLTAKSAKTMSGWHRIRKPEATEVEENRSPAVLEKKEDVLWQTAHRSFTVPDLKNRQVSRKTGLAILSAVK